MSRSIERTLPPALPGNPTRSSKKEEATLRRVFGFVACASLLTAAPWWVNRGETAEPVRTRTVAGNAGSSASSPSAEQLFLQGRQDYLTGRAAGRSCRQALEAANRANGDLTEDDRERLRSWLVQRSRRQQGGRTAALEIEIAEVDCDEIACRHRNAGPRTTRVDCPAASRPTRPRSRVPPTNKRPPKPVATRATAKLPRPANQKPSLLSDEVARCTIRRRDVRRRERSRITEVEGRGRRIRPFGRRRRTGRRRRPSRKIRRPKTKSHRRAEGFKVGSRSRPGRRTIEASPGAAAGRPARRRRESRFNTLRNPDVAYEIAGGQPSEYVLNLIKTRVRRDTMLATKVEIA